MIMLLKFEALREINSSLLHLIVFANCSEYESGKEDEDVRTESDRDSSSSIQQSANNNAD